mmetsp:Transcript_25068/g.70210  ORF Transcript_25068/g.70210 Transcript_25068/m.70210 type:complete len:207 (+) Transcript_25068:1207-1827(+)
MEPDPQACEQCHKRLDFLDFLPVPEAAHPPDDVGEGRHGLRRQALLQQLLRGFVRREAQPAQIGHGLGEERGRHLSEEEQQRRQASVPLGAFRERGVFVQACHDDPRVVPQSLPAPALMQRRVAPDLTQEMHDIACRQSRLRGHQSAQEAFRRALQQAGQSLHLQRDVLLRGSFSRWPIPLCAEQGIGPFSGSCGDGPVGRASCHE